MKEYTREYPYFALCGLNCGLCPHLQTKGASRCPGCGGTDFYLKHPSCGVISCSNKHDQVEFCFQCSAYPCDRYSSKQSEDSFISYRNVLADFAKAKADFPQYKTDINEKMRIVEFLIDNYNDGRKKSFYCQAVNLLDLNDLRDIIEEINEKISRQDGTLKEKIEQIQTLFEDKARSANIDFKLRKLQ